MMSLLIPLGLLGLLSLIAWLVIYLIKPNYQQKVISSTFIWKLSLKYKKKRLPINKLRNILLIICQILILVSCALILARPAVVYQAEVNKNEVIVILDSSASMRTETNEETRYERAVIGVKKLAENVFNGGGTVSVILAEQQSTFLADRITSENKDILYAELDKLISNIDELACSYGSSDMDSAFTLCEDLLSANPSAKIYVYTDTRYDYVPEDINVNYVYDSEEWNAAILDAKTELTDGYYKLTVSVACYGVDAQLDLRVEVGNANAEGKDDDGMTLEFSQFVTCSDDEPVTVVFRNGDVEDENESKSDKVVYYDISSKDKFYSYNSIRIYLEENDSFGLDNTFQIYGGMKQQLKVEYASSAPNRFFNAALGMVRSQYDERWDIQVTEVKDGNVKTEGFDLYIFEHVMPDKLPEDGVVFLCDLDSVPQGSNLMINGEYTASFDVSLARETEHPLLNNIDIDEISVRQINNITSYDSSYEVLASCQDHPVMLVKNEGKNKVFISAFSIHYSNFVITKHFPRLFLNFFNYFFPASTNGNAFEVNEQITINAVGEKVFCSGAKEPFTQFPAQMSFYIPGTYTFTQTSYFGKEIVENVYVKIPMEESNINKTENGLTSPFKRATEVERIDDLLLYFAIALVSLLFIEWLLQAKDNF